MHTYQTCCFFAGFPVVPVNAIGAVSVKNTGETGKIYRYEIKPVFIIFLLGFMALKSQVTSQDFIYTPNAHI